MAAGRRRAKATGADDGDAVRDLEDLVKILADDEHCRTGAGKIDQRLPDGERRLGIDAPVG